MRRVLAVLFVFLIASPCVQSQDPKPPPTPVPFVRPEPPPGASIKIRLPVLPVVPVPVPVPIPTPGGDIVLTDSAVYVVDSNTELAVITSPEGILNVEEDVGPIKVKSLFVDASTPGKQETKAFAGPWVYTISAAAVGKVELILVPVGFSSTDQIIRKTFDANIVPGPPVPPGPIPPGPIPPGPPPVPATTVLYVTMLYDGNAPSPAVSAVTVNPDLDAALKAANCIVNKLDVNGAEASKRGFLPVVAKAGGPPALVIQAAGVATPVVAPRKLPASAAEVQAIITQLRKAG